MNGHDDDDDSLGSLSWKLDFVVRSLSKTFFDVFYYRPSTLNGGPSHPGSYELSFCIVQQLIIINLCMFFLCSPAVCTRQTCKLNNNKAKCREKHQFTLCSCSESRFGSGPVHRWKPIFNLLCMECLRWRVKLRRKQNIGWGEYMIPNHFGEC